MEVVTREMWETVSFENSGYACRECGETHLIDKRNARLEPRGGAAFRGP